MSASTPLDPAVAWDLRQPERHLLLWCLACVAIGLLLVLGSGQAAERTPTLADLVPLGVYALSLTATHLVLVGGGLRTDQILVATVAFLAGLGLLAQTRMGAFDGTDTLSPDRLLFPAGMLVMAGVAAAFAGGRYRLLGATPWVWAGLSLILVGVLLATGQRFRGAVFGLGFTTPTEALKLTVVLFLAGYLDRQGRALGRWHPRWPLPPWRPLWPLALFWLLLAGLLVLQRDLGMTTILGATLLVLLVAGSGRLGYLVYGVIGSAGLGWLMLGVFEHGERRIDAWLDPFQDPTGDGWQILQGLSGMYSGGLWGEGFGEGRPDFTPIAGSDFIYSVIGEELGFLGCAAVVLFFLILFQRGLQIAGGSRNPFGRLLALGIVAVLTTQTFLNIGGVTKLVPLTGLTLPFISHGGASLLTAFATIGLLLAVSDGEPAAPPRPPRQPRLAPAADVADKPAPKRRAPRQKAQVPP
jgi:cell division protein FtsW (lipid II flippase)